MLFQSTLAKALVMKNTLNILFAILLTSSSAVAGDSYLNCYEKGKEPGDGEIVQGLVSFEKNPGAMVFFDHPTKEATKVSIVIVPAVGATDQFHWDATIYITDAGWGGVKITHKKNIGFAEDFIPTAGVHCFIED